MPTPVANFSRTVNGLEITFNDLSINNPTSWNWDFGDGTTSTDQNPSHTYSAGGFFVVTFTATNGDGTSDPLIVTIGVNADQPVLGLSIHDMISQNLPNGIEVDRSNEMTLINKWQLYLAPLVSPTIADADIYDETKWPPLVNQIIAMLVTIDLIMQGANAYLLSLGNSEGASGKDVKKITTGPTDAEWFSGSDTWYGIMRPGGLYESIQAQICYLASRERIWLPFCPRLEFSPVIPCKVVTNTTWNSFTNPLSNPDNSVPSQG